MAERVPWVLQAVHLSSGETDIESLHRQMVEKGADKV